MISFARMMKLMKKILMCPKLIFSFLRDYQKYQELFDKSSFENNRSLSFGDLKPMLMDNSKETGF